MNCDTDKCKAECCGLAPMPKKLYKKNKKKIQRKIDNIFELNSTTIVVIDKDGVCAFLSKEYKCAIYNDRPPICKLFGVLDHPLMQCSHLKS